MTETRFRIALVVRSARSSWWNSAQVFVSTESGEMSLLVALPECLENLIKRTRFGCWDVLYRGLPHPETVHF